MLLPRFIEAMNLECASRQSGSWRFRCSMYAKSPIRSSSMEREATSRNGAGSAARPLLGWRRGDFRMKLRIVVVGLLCLGSAAAQTPDELRKMVDANQMFALRDAVEHETKVGVFYRMRGLIIRPLLLPIEHTRHSTAAAPGIGAVRWCARHPIVRHQLRRVADAPCLRDIRYRPCLD